MDQKEAFRIVKDFVKFLQGKGYNVQKAYIFGHMQKEFITRTVTLIWRSY